MDTPQLLEGPAPDGEKQTYEDAIIYEGTSADEILYEGSVVLHPNGWLQVEDNRLLSPSAVHHIDVYDEVASDDGSAETTSDETPAVVRMKRWGYKPDPTDRNR
ncbi:hypothetical protein ACLI4Z_02395 [Natrialbaceae archaeon A-arb3/5]